MTSTTLSPKPMMGTINVQETIEPLSTKANKLVTHLGGCHCGAVRFSVRAPAHVDVFKCNCSICTKKQNYPFIVPKSRFTLLKGADSLTTYTFLTGQAKHTFCKVCGVQSFYTPRSNPDGYDCPVTKLMHMHISYVTATSPARMKWSINPFTAKPDYNPIYCIMPHCTDDGTIKSKRVVPFGGKQWEEAMKDSDVAEYSKENESNCVM